jgi:hypothetical protein
MGNGIYEEKTMVLEDDALVKIRNKTLPYLLVFVIIG